MGWARDTELVLAARAGDPEAFGRLFDAWFPSVYDIAYRIVRQREAAADVAQDTFLAAWQGLAGLDRPGSFGGWLRRIARNRALNRLESDKRAVVDGDEVAAVLDRSAARSATDTDMTADLTRAEQHEMVWSAARTLGPRDASLLDLHLRHGLGAGEIAVELGITPNNAHQLLYRLRGKMAEAARAWVLWRTRGRGCAVLDQAIGDGELAEFGAPVVRSIARHVTGCETCTRTQQLALQPEALFAAVPLLVVPAGLQHDVATQLVAHQVPMGAAYASGGGGPLPGTGPGGGALYREGPDGGDPDQGGPEVHLPRPVIPGPRGPRLGRRAVAVLVAALVLLVGGGVVAAMNNDGDAPSLAAVVKPSATPVHDSTPSDPSVVPSPSLTPTVSPTPTPTTTTPTTTTTTTTPPAVISTTSTPTLTVTTPAPATTTTPSTTTPPPPVIGGFRLTDTGVCATDRTLRAVDLVWQSTGAETATLTDPSGQSSSVAPSATTSTCGAPGGTFTLVVTGAGGTDEASATVPTPEP
jgi:RNA polymerase sigma factor (sigma-70 family)